MAGLGGGGAGKGPHTPLYPLLQTSSSAGGTRCNRQKNKPGDISAGGIISYRKYNLG